jgi:peptidoglycan/LPS O-acetylase OafA/YrhL
MNSSTEMALEGELEEAKAVARPHLHMPSLDGLRGAAILLVLFDHMSRSLTMNFSFNNKLFYWAELGWSGVDLFFVLSGFLITGILFDAKGTECFFKNFYARRALRIFPLYYTALALVFLITPLLVRLNLPEGTCNPAWMTIYGTNFVLSANGDGAFGVLDHFWSLAVEEHFYLVWPAIVFFLNRKKLMIVAACACVIAPLLRLWTMNGGDMLPYSAYMNTPMRMDSLAAGAFIALMVRGPKGMAGIVKPAMIVAVAAFAVFLSIVLLRHTKSPHDYLIGTVGFSTLWAFYGAVLLLALNWSPLQMIMSSPVLRWFGKYSYGMYVWHPVVFMLVFHSDISHYLRQGDWRMQAISSCLIGLAAMLAVTLASWHLWEKQFLKLKGRFA